MKKRIIVFLVTILVLATFAFSSAVFAKNDNVLSNFKNLDRDEILVSETAEITDSDKLFDRAKNEGTQNPHGIVQLKKDGVDVDTKNIQVYTTVQKLASKKNIRNGKITNLYKQSSFVIVPSSTLATETDVGHAYDTSVGVRCDSTIYYEETFCSGYKFVKMTKLSGTWTKLDSSITWSNSKIGPFVQGTATNSSCSSQTQVVNGYYEMTPSSGNPTSGVIYSMTPWLNNYTNLRNLYVSNFQLTDYNQANYKISLRRSTTSWDFTYTNYIDK